LIQWRLSFQSIDQANKIQKINEEQNLSDHEALNSQILKPSINLEHYKEQKNKNKDTWKRRKSEEYTSAKKKEILSV